MRKFFLVFLVCILLIPLTYLSTYSDKPLGMPDIGLPSQPSFQQHFTIEGQIEQAKALHQLIYPLVSNLKHLK